MFSGLVQTINNNRILWFLPAIVGLFTYLSTYFGSQFSGAETFNVASIALEIFQLYLYGLIALFFISKTEDFSKRYFCCSVGGIILANLAINSTIKQIFITFYGQNDSLGWLHYVNYMVEGFVVGFAVTFLAIVVLSQKRQQALLLKQKELEKQASEARLSALQTQINPHFLFNNLNTLQALITPENKGAQSYLANLSDLLRAMLTSHEFPLFSLREDIECANLYLSLINIRFENGIQLNLDTPNANNWHLPPFTLQLLLENVVKHNRLDNKEPLEVYVSINDNTLIVRNEKRPVTSPVDSTKVGLANLNERFILLTERQLVTEETPELFIVKAPLIEVQHYD